MRAAEITRSRPGRARPARRARRGHARRSRPARPVRPVRRPPRPRGPGPACEELEAEFRSAWADRGFRADLDAMLRDYVGRPTPVTEAATLSRALGLRVLLKREDLAHTGSHKINNVVAQGLLARRMGKTELIAETGAGQHGVAAATVAAHLGLACTVFMGAKDIERQELNVFRMELLGATVVPVTTGSRTLKDATTQALRHWVTVDRLGALLRRLGGRPASVPVDGPGVPAGHRRRGPGAVRAAAARRRPRRGGRLRGRRLQRGGHVRRASRPRRPAWSASRRPAAPP